MQNSQVASVASVGEVIVNPQLLIEKSAKLPNQEKKKDKKVRREAFTVNNFTENMFASLASLFEGRCKKPKSGYIMAREIGECGTPHIQGFFISDSQIRVSQLTKCCEYTSENGEIKTKYRGFSNMKGEKRFAQYWVNYCHKFDKDPINTFGLLPQRELKIIQEFRPWQKQVVDKLDGYADDRSIIWVFDREGNIGKSQLTRWLMVKKNARLIQGKGNDILFAIGKFLKDNPCITDLPPIIYDIPRHLEGYISYSAIEMLKDGKFFSGKYESEQFIFNPPHIVCFANFPPNTTMMSLDRWKIFMFNPDDDKLYRVQL